MPSTLAEPYAAGERRWVDIRTPLPEPGLGLVSGYAGAAIEVADLERARAFYAGLLGFSQEGPARLKIGGAFLDLAQTAEPRAWPESGFHHAYRLPPAELEAALKRLQGAGAQVCTYHEDRPAERDQNRYCLDPDGNRVQLVAGVEPGIDHAAIETHDLEWAEVFYTQVLGATVESRVGWHMDDFSRALRWGEGQDDCAPGTRRWDKRYTTIEHQGRLARPNAQTFVTFAPGVTLGIYLATEHRQEPPPDQFVGTPRLCFRADVQALAARLQDVRLRCMQASPDTSDPFERAGGLLFVRDPGGNFLEFQE